LQVAEIEGADDKGHGLSWPQSHKNALCAKCGSPLVTQRLAGL